LNCREIEEY